MKATFAQLGIPFLLFEGPVGDASSYAGEEKCLLCGKQAPHCFQLGIGSDVIASCTRCSTANALDGDDRKNAPCTNCGNEVTFPPNDPDDELHVCYGCLREGKAGLTQDTEIGMVRWQDAVSGMTHGRPGLRRTDFELSPGESEGWFRAKVQSDVLIELTRTPSYTTWQGEQWLFCCRNPMTFLGEWDAADFNRNAQDGNGRVLFEQIVEDQQPGMWECGIGGGVCVYVFRCNSCARFRAHWDMN